MDNCLIVFISVSLVLLIRGQSNERIDSPSDVRETRRTAKSSFDAQFHRGLCPDYFYQLGDECLYFATNGKIYAWEQAQKACEQKVAQLVGRQTTFSIGQPKVRSIRGVRQLILNTPEKTKIVEAIYREYDELSYAVRLASDLNPLHRCNDGQEDHWPQYCHNPTEGFNTTCFDTNELGSDHICLRQVDCAKPYLRLACEYTLPGSPVLMTSKFRQCPNVRGLRQRLTIWAWILIAVGAMLLLLLILGGFLAFLRNSKTKSPPTKRSISEGRPTEEPVTRRSTTRADSASEPMLVRGAPATVSDTGYLEAQPLRRAAPSTTTTATVKPDDINANL